MAEDDSSGEGNEVDKEADEDVLHLPYWKPDTKERFLLIHGSYNCCCLFQYKLLLCHDLFLKREDSSRLMLAYHCLARGITNIG